jgi:VWFA-related protein
MTRVRGAGIAIAAAVVLLTLGSASADDPIELDLVVTDAQSRPITNLQPTEVELIDSGEPRVVESIRRHASGGRALGILLDDFHVSAGESTTRARAALTEFVNTQLRDGDSIAVVKPLDPLHAITFTQDRDVVRHAIATFDGREGDFSPRTEFERNFMSRNPQTASAARAQVVSAALQALARQLGQQQPGRKALIFLSEGFSPAQPRAIIYAANRARVAVHAIDPNREPNEFEPMLRAIAEQTGGDASINDADLSRPFKQAISDLDNHYIVSFRLPEPGDGRLHPVQVRVKRSNVLARVRAGYWAPNRALAESLASAAAARPTQPFRPSHSSPYIRPWIGMARGPDGLTSVTVTWEAGAAPPRNQQLAAVDVKATTQDGRVLHQQRIGAGDIDRVTFNAPPGLIALEMALQSSTGAALDTDYRGLSVPSFQAAKAMLGTPQVLRTRTARTFVQLSEDASAPPVASRTFSRTERLIIRVPAYVAGDESPAVTARLLNSKGTAMRNLPLIESGLPEGLVQFDLPLSSLAPENYRVELVAANPVNPRDEAKELIVFRVTN